VGPFIFLAGFVIGTLVTLLTAAVVDRLSVEQRPQGRAATDSAANESRGPDTPLS
jgi:hypothetical protein